ncbi:hypothetical protein, variant [Gaeumannomyces tritici R3-111a-1]|uniref:Uncharacterized protein n=1 Tax=Gaeumannomyces tritici (strain R3-111a-1) TaxID=644352 RepID=J3P3R6_GAET3|nr:hypothetical protein GGTG_08151 [Gaeumannomyces tritici R3-111a-1]XP_009224254.1 hypothetical protein, variant [Gaeumannomyces tritici R3-111a-1]EJT74309.1 hypothetical protein, variant [Gaeumannomyces tritici R3-111a-1]EJT74310.1 hypothetical protein GGTG_08151 [Gaeumannomyces tritici R3-111a-1]
MERASRWLALGSGALGPKKTKKKRPCMLRDGGHQNAPFSPLPSPCDNSLRTPQAVDGDALSRLVKDAWPCKSTPAGLSCNGLIGMGAVTGGQKAAEANGQRPSQGQGQPRKPSSDPYGIHPR